MNPAPNLVLVGPMGSGKSSIGRRLAERFDLAFLDADREVEAQAGASISTIFECAGEADFRAREQIVLARLLAGEGAVVATGGGAVTDPLTRDLLRQRGFVVHLHIDVPGQLERLARDRTRPLLATGDREQVLRRLAETRDPLYAEVADLRFDTGAMNASDTVAELGHLLDLHWQMAATPARSTTP